MLGVIPDIEPVTRQWPGGVRRPSSGGGGEGAGVSGSGSVS